MLPQLAKTKQAIFKLERNFEKLSIKVRKVKKGIKI